jgi:hypothetical protein
VVVFERALELESHQLVDLSERLVQPVMSRSPKRCS